MAHCSKRKVGKTNYSKNLAHWSKGKVGKTNYSKILARFAVLCICMYLRAFSNC